MRFGQFLPAAIFVATGFAFAIQAQLQPEFDAVSIKPSVARMNGPVKFGAGRAFSTSVSAYRMILAAYNLKEYQLVGVTGWIGSDWYALEARTDKPSDESLLRLMLQTLLRKRFGLVVHSETREMPVFALVEGKNGSKLKPWNEGNPVPKGAGTASETGLSHETMDSIVTLLNLPGFQKVSGIDRPVLDKTNLHGTYLVFNAWYDSWEDFQTAALEDQMGLKLVSQKEPMKVMVIDHIEKPSAN